MSKAKAESASLQEHIVAAHGYPYDDADEQPIEALKGWHQEMHKVEAQAEHAKFEAPAAEEE